MRRRTLFLPFCVLLICAPLSLALSQSIEVTHAVAPVNQLSISDIDFRHSTTPKWLFTITIRVLGGESVRATMRVSAGFSFPNESPYDNALTFETDTFTVAGTKSISNLDIDRTVRLCQRADCYQFSSQARRRLEEIALPTGQIPAGTYSFDVEVTVNGVVTFDRFTIVLSNPSTLELISPSDGDQFVTQFPVFQWQYDGPSSRISVFEKLAGQGSLEEAASGIAHYSTVTSTNSLRYPTSGARLLEPGKTYVWFVEGLAGAAGGSTVSTKSALRSFTVISNGAESLSSLLDELARTLPQYQALFDELKAQGFTAGATMSLNGSPVSVSELQKILNNLRLHPDAVTLVESE